MPKVSIIVPVYNAEAVVDRCIQSILKQTYHDFELLLMDDGSQDRSGAICDRAAADDPRVRVVHKSNSGVSDTRNQGLQLAKGEYVQFLDADDWITEHATEMFVRTMEESHADMVISDFYRVKGEHVAKKGAIEEDGLLNIKDFTAELITRPADFYYGVLWNKFFKRSILEQFQIRMDKNISWCEDFIFNLDYMVHCQSVYVLKVPLYYYVYTEGSLVSQGMDFGTTMKMKQIVFRHYSSYCKSVFGTEEYQRRQLQVYRYFVDVARDGIMLPSVFPTTHKLGEERAGISEAVLQGEGDLFAAYREEKLQDRLLEVVAMRNDLSLEDVRLLYFLSRHDDVLTEEEVVELLNTTVAKLGSSLRRLRSSGLIMAKSSSVDLDALLRWFTSEESFESKKDDREKDRIREEGFKKAMKSYVLTSEGDHIVDEILFMMNDFEQIRYDGFTDEEQEMYRKLEKKKQDNIKKALS